jgi:hypothetical protein
MCLRELCSRCHSRPGYHQPNDMAISILTSQPGTCIIGSRDDGNRTLNNFWQLDARRASEAPGSGAPQNRARASSLLMLFADCTWRTSNRRGIPQMVQMILLVGGGPVPTASPPTSGRSARFQQSRPHPLVESDHAQPPSTARCSLFACTGHGDP